MNSNQFTRDSSSDEDAHYETDTPAPGDGEEISVLRVAQFWLGHGSISENLSNIQNFIQTLTTILKGMLDNPSFDYILGLHLSINNQEFVCVCVCVYISHYEAPIWKYQLMNSEPANQK